MTESAPPTPAPPPRRRVRPSTVVLALAALVGLGLLALLGVTEARRAGLLSPGSSAPGFTLTRYDGGGTLSLRDLQGKVVLLDFWATWCMPCRQEMPTLVRLAREYEGRGVTLVALSQDAGDEGRAQVDDFVRRFVPDLKPHVAFGPDAVAETFQVQGLPTLFFLDRSGKVVDVLLGARDERELRERLERVLAAGG